MIGNEQLFESESPETWTASTVNREFDENGAAVDNRKQPLNYSIQYPKNVSDL